MPTKRAKIDVYKAIQIDLVSEGKATKGWCHTHGLAAHGLPELEMRGVPLYLAPDAARMLNAIADYMLNSGKTVKLGQTMGLGDVTIRFAKSMPIQGDEAHFAQARWEVVDAMEGACGRHPVRG